MAELLRIFVSATRDLEAERAIVGQTLADLPVEIGAEIRRTPAEGISYESLFELVGNVDRFYFLLGQDISAPAGAEWSLALRLERDVVPLRLAGSHTPAAHEFLGATPVDWRIFRNRNHLAQLLGLDLIDLLLHPRNRYGLSLAEMDLMRIRRKQIREGMIAARDEPGGAEGGGVLLDRDRAIESADGVLVGEQESVSDER